MNTNKTTNDDTAAMLTAALSLNQRADTAPEWILYLPAGETQINGSLNGKPASMVVVVDEAAAQALQSDLQARRDSGVMPTLDFDHEGKRASGVPEAFRWNPARGVEVKAGWTAAGAASVVSKEYLYFSPEFKYNTKTKRVLGLLPNGPIGGLVNDPAFRNIGAILARHQPAGLMGGTPMPQEISQHGLDSTKQTNETNMKHQLIAEGVVTAGLLTAAEAALDNAPTLLNDRVTALRATPEETAEVKALRTELTTLKAAAAKEAVEAAVKAGRIAPADKESQAWWEELIVRDGVKASAALGKLPVAFEVPKDSGLPGAQVQAAAKPEALTDAQAAAVQAKASQLKTANPNLSWSQAWDQASAEVSAQ